MVPQDQYLLKKTKIKGNTATVIKDDIEVFLKQKPNKKMLGIFRFRLMLYNISKGGEHGKISEWLATKTGEKPVIYDSILGARTRENIEDYLHSRGYYNAEVSLDLKIKRSRNIKAKYNISIGDPYRIRLNMLNVEDSVLLGLIVKKMKSSYILEGNIFDIELLKKEQERITKLIRKEGYYSFSQKDIYFQADSTGGTKQADIYLHIPNRTDKTTGLSLPHRKFTVRNTYIIPKYDFKKAAESKALFLASADTVQYSDSVFFLEHGKRYIKHRTIMRSNYIRNGMLYSTSDADATQRKLSKNKLFKIARINFTEVDTLKTDSTGMLDCYIMLTPFTFQSYGIDLEASSTGGDYGAKLQFSYNHKNLLHGSENITINLTHSRKLIKNLDQSDNAINIFNTQEYSVEGKFETPHFLSPFRFEEFQKQQSPSTILKTGYSYNHNLNYTSPHTYLSYGFSWRKNKNLKYVFTPSEISGVRYFQMDSSFREYINSNPYYRASYENYLITAINFTVLYSDQSTSKLKNHTHHKVSVETAGNLLNTFIETTEDQLDNAELGLLQTKQTQYAKFDYDFRYYNVQTEHNQTVFRFVGGLAYPYGPRASLPGIKQYYAGGLNSMRAWTSRSLGPGSYEGEKDPSSAEARFKYYLGDIKLEANLEQRFHMFWHLDGALFVDAGNIWTFYDDAERNGTQFQFSKLMNDIAIGAGIGLRFDFDFFVFRVDTGLKLRDPANREISKWVIRHGVAYSDWNMNIGIGYPF